MCIWGRPRARPRRRQVVVAVEAGGIQHWRVTSGRRARTASPPACQPSSRAGTARRAGCAGRALESEKRQRSADVGVVLAVREGDHVPDKLAAQVVGDLGTARNSGPWPEQGDQSSSPVLPAHPGQHLPPSAGPGAGTAPVDERRGLGRAAAVVGARARVGAVQHGTGGRVEPEIRVGGVSGVDGSGARVMPAASVTRRAAQSPAREPRVDVGGVTAEPPRTSSPAPQRPQILVGGRVRR